MGRCEKLSTFCRTSRNTVVCAIAALLFFTAWWLLIDLEAAYTDLMHLKPIYYSPVALGTLSFVIVNILAYNRSPPTPRSEASTAEKGAEKDKGKKGEICNQNLRALAICFGLILAFTSLAAAVYILIQDFVHVTECMWPGVSILLAAIILFISNLFFKFGVKNKKPDAAK